MTRRAANLLSILAKPARHSAFRGQRIPSMMRPLRSTTRHLATLLKANLAPPNLRRVSISGLYP
jgi:hypothetical protein